MLRLASELEERLSENVVFVALDEGGDCSEDLEDVEEVLVDGLAREIHVLEVEAE